jgi:GT2 family glycosyltransferase
MGVSIVIPTWNGLSLLQQFLPSVLAAATHYSSISDAPVEIVIVDDGSVDGTVVWLRGQGFAETGRTRVVERPRPELRFASNGENLGFGETANRGFELAKYPLVLLLNNDVEVDPDCIAPLVEIFEDGSVFAAHCRVFEFDSGRECGTGKLGSFSRGFIRVHRSYTPASAEAPGFGLANNLSGELSKGVSKQNSGSQLSNEAPSRRQRFYSMFAGGGSAMFDRRKVLEVGGFEPLLSPFYWEDVELSYRAWKRGFAIVYEPRSVTRHRVSSTIGKLDRGKVRVIEQRNRLIYHWIHLRDARMLASHIAWVTVLAVTAPVRFKPGFLVSCVKALRKLPAIRKRRDEEGREEARTDREVFEIFKMLEADPSVMAYDDPGELQHQAE